MQLNLLSDMKYTIIKQIQTHTRHKFYLKTNISHQKQLKLHFDKIGLKLEIKIAKKIDRYSKQQVGFNS